MQMCLSLLYQLIEGTQYLGRWVERRRRWVEQYLDIQATEGTNPST